MRAMIMEGGNRIQNSECRIQNANAEAEFRIQSTVSILNSAFCILNLSLGPRVRLADRQGVLKVGVGPRDDVHGHELTDAPRGCGTGVGGSLHRGHVAAHDRGHVTGTDLFPADQRDLGGLDHGVSRLNHGDQPLGLDHAQRLTHRSSQLTNGRIYDSTNFSVKSRQSNPSIRHFVNGHTAHRRLRTASAISCVSSAYVSRISPVSLAARTLARSAAPPSAGAAATRRSDADTGASSTWHSTWSPAAASAGSAQSGAGAAMP